MTSIVLFLSALLSGGSQSQPPVRIVNPTNPNPMPGDARMTQFDFEVKGASWRVFAVDSLPNGPINVVQVSEVRQHNPPSIWAVHVANRELQTVASFTDHRRRRRHHRRDQGDSGATRDQEPEARPGAAARDAYSRDGHRANRSRRVLRARRDQRNRQPAGVGERCRGAGQVRRRRSCRFPSGPRVFAYRRVAELIDAETAAGPRRSAVSSQGLKEAMVAQDLAVAVGVGRAAPPARARERDTPINMMMMLRAAVPKRPSGRIQGASRLTCDTSMSSSAPPRQTIRSCVKP